MMSQLKEVAGRTGWKGTSGETNNQSKVTVKATRHLSEQDVTLWSGQNGLKQAEVFVLAGCPATFEPEEHGSTKL